MICNLCGTEGAGNCCPRCGTPFTYAYGAPPAAAPSAPPAVPATGGKTRRKKPKIRMAMVFSAATALLTPLLWFFTDLFVLFTPRVTAESAGVSRLGTVMARFFDAAYDTNTVAEITEGTFGRGEYMNLVSVRSFFGVYGGGEMAYFRLPIAAVALLSLASAAMGVMVIVTAGRALRRRAVASAASVSAVGAAFAPLFGLLLFRAELLLTYRDVAAVEEVMRRVCFSAESVLGMLFFACSVLPAVAALRKVAAYAQEEPYYVGTLVRTAGAAYPVARGIAAGAAVIAMLSAAVVLVLPVTDAGAILNVPALRAELPALWADCRALFSAGGAGEDLPRLLASTVRLISLVSVPLTVLSLLFTLTVLSRMLTVSGGSLAHRQHTRRLLAGAGGTARTAVLLPFFCFAAAHLALTCYLLCGTHVAAHLDFSDVENTLRVGYLSVVTVRSLGGVTTAYVGIAALGALAANLFGGMARQMICLADANGKKEKN